MTRSCPVIVSRTGALPELAAGAALFCDPHRPETLADAISRLLASPILSDALKRRGRARAHGYTWRRCAAEVANALQNISGGQASPDRNLFINP